MEEYTMAAACRYNWETIRAEYEAGATMGELSRRHGVDKAAISRRARGEGWTRDVSGAVDRLTDAKVNGIVNTADPQKKAEAIDRAAEAKAAVIMRHKAEWDRHKVIMDEALANEDFNVAKLAKITAEMLKIRQDGERRAWGIQDKSEPGPAVPVRAEVRLDLAVQPSQAVTGLARVAFRAQAQAKEGGAE